MAAHTALTRSIKVVQRGATLPVSCGRSPSYCRALSKASSGVHNRSPVLFWRSVQPAVQRNERQQAGHCAAAAAAASADGGGGNGSDGSGGGGGAGDGDGLPGDASGGWDARRIWTLTFALAVIGGGVYAYVKKGSRPSLIASSGVGACLLAAVWQMGFYQQAGLGIALVTSALLAVVMGNRYRKSRNFMPSGMLALVSAVSAWWYASWPS